MLPNITNVVKANFILNLSFLHIRLQTVLELKQKTKRNYKIFILIP
jgi:hypothetical protein